MHERCRCGSCITSHRPLAEIAAQLTAEWIDAELAIAEEDRVALRAWIFDHDDTVAMLTYVMGTGHFPRMDARELAELAELVRTAARAKVDALARHDDPVPVAS